MSDSNIEDNINDATKIIVEAVRGIPDVEVPDGFREEVMRAIRIEASLSGSAKGKAVLPHNRINPAKIIKRKHLYFGASAACLILVFMFIVYNPAKYGGGSSYTGAQVAPAEAPAAAPAPSAPLYNSSPITEELASADDVFVGGIGETGVMSDDMGFQSAAGAVPEAARAEAEADIPSTAQESPESSVAVNSVAGNQPNTSQKLIKTVYYTIEITDFDKAISEIQFITEATGGYVESFYSGIYSVYSSAEGSRDLKNGEIRIRIPRNEYSPAKTKLENLGKTVAVSENIENVTSNYIDIAARLDVKKTEEQRLLELYGKADKIEDLISLEARLSYVRSDIESMVSQLKNWDRDVSFSTISITLTEVVDYSQIQSIDPSLGQKIKEGFNRSIANFTYNIERIIIGIAENSIAILITAFVVVVLLGIAYIYRKRKKVRSFDDDIY